MKQAFGKICVYFGGQPDADFQQQLAAVRELVAIEFDDLELQLSQGSFGAAGWAAFVDHHVSSFWMPDQVVDKIVNLAPSAMAVFIEAAADSFIPCYTFCFSDNFPGEQATAFINGFYEGLFQQQRINLEQTLGSLAPPQATA